MPSRPSTLVGWVSSGNPHDGPDATLQTNGFAANAQPPQRFFNWLLKDVLTTWIDNWLYPIAAEYRHTRVFNNPTIMTLAPTGSYAQPMWYITSNASGPPGLNGAAVQVLTQTSQSAGGVAFQLNLPMGARTIQSITVHVAPAGGHTSTPSTLPAFRFLVVDATGATVASVSQPDTVAPTSSSVAGDIAAYEAAHSFTHGSLAQAFDPTTQRALVQVFGENGTGGQFVAGLAIQSVVVTYDYDLQDDVIISSPED